MLANAKIAEAAFAGAVGIEPEATDLGDGGYAWVDVLGITPEKQKSFEEVKDEVKTNALEADRRKEVTALAAKLVERLGKGFHTVIARYGFTEQPDVP